MKVFITGSQGFLAGYVVSELLENGYYVVGIDDYSKYGVIKRKHDNHPNFTLYRYNLIEDFDKIKDLVNLLEPDYIIHLAAKIGGICYFHEYPFDLIKDNAIMDSNITDIATKYWSKKILLKRFIGFSSSMVFENANIFPTPESHIINCPPPSSSYGFSKLSLEYKIKAAHEQYFLPYTIIRPFNAVGCGEDDFIHGKKSHVMVDFIVNLLNGKTILPVLGSGSQVRCYTNGSDIARGTRLAIESPNGLNNDFNISTSTSTTVLELGSLIWEKIYPNKTFKFTTEKPFKYDVQKRIPDVSKAKKLLGFESKISLDESIDECIEYIKNKLNQ